LLPNFICPGAQKSATTTLYNLLHQHPDVYLPDVKELHFFDNEEKYLKGISWYEKEFFSEVKGEKVIGDITPIYMYLDYIPQRIYNALGENIKFIFMLRNPIDRAYSHYWMSNRRGYEKESFEKAIELEKDRVRIGNFEKINFSYIERGFYSKQIKNFLYYFPKKNMKFILFEDLIWDTSDIMKQILSFLEVDSNISINYNIKSNPAKMPKSIMLRDFIQKPSTLVKETTKLLIPNKKLRSKAIQAIENINYRKFKKPDLKLETRYKLLKIYEEDIKKLENVINKDLSLWFK
jgi:hypothetical protein